MAEVPRRGVDQAVAAFAIARTGLGFQESSKGFQLVGKAPETQGRPRFVMPGAAGESYDRPTRKFVTTAASVSTDSVSYIPKVVSSPPVPEQAEPVAEGAAKVEPEVTYTADGTMEVFGLQFHPVGQRPKDSSDTQEPKNHRLRRRKRAGVVATAAVAGAALAACSGPGTPTQSSTQRPSYSSSSGAFDPGVPPDGSVDWVTTVTNFGSIPQAVEKRKDAVFKVHNGVNARVDDGGATSTEQAQIDATGSVASINGQRVGLTAGHVYRGEVRPDGSILTYSCGDSTDAYPGGTIRVRAAASEFNPFIAAVGNESIDLAVSAPAPESVPAIPSGGIPKISQKVYIDSLQPLTPDGPELDPSKGQNPSIIEGVVIGLLPGTHDQYVVLTGFGGSRKGIYATEDGASGAPVLNTAGQRVGEEVMGSDAIHVPAGGQLSSADLSALQVYYGIKGIYVEPDAGPINFYLSVFQADAVPADQKVIKRGIATMHNKQNACL